MEDNQKDKGFDSIESIVDFQLERRFSTLSRNLLVILEEKYEYIYDLLKTLQKAGFEVESKYLFENDRKKVLGGINDTKRELQAYLTKFDIKLKN